MSAAKQMRRSALVRKRKERRVETRARERENAIAAAARRQEMRDAPPSGRRSHMGLMPASMALAALALVGGGW
jgi:hypothetical protein